MFTICFVLVLFADQIVYGKADTSLDKNFPDLIRSKKNSIPVSGGIDLNKVQLFNDEKDFHEDPEPFSAIPGTREKITRENVNEIPERERRDAILKGITGLAVPTPVQTNMEAKDGDDLPTVYKLMIAPHKFKDVCAKAVRFLKEKMCILGKNGFTESGQEVTKSINVGKAVLKSDPITPQLINKITPTKEPESSVQNIANPPENTSDLDIGKFITIPVTSHTKENNGEINAAPLLPFPCEHLKYLFGLNFVNHENVNQSPTKVERGSTGIGKVLKLANTSGSDKGSVASIKEGINTVSNDSGGSSISGVTPSQKSNNTIQTVTEALAPGNTLQIINVQSNVTASSNQPIAVPVEPVAGTNLTSEIQNVKTDVVRDGIIDSVTSISTPKVKSELHDIDDEEAVIILDIEALPLVRSANISNDKMGYRRSSGETTTTALNSPLKNNGMDDKVGAINTATTGANNSNITQNLLSQDETNTINENSTPQTTTNLTTPVNISETDSFEKDYNAKTTSMPARISTTLVKNLTSVVPTVAPPQETLLNNQSSNSLETKPESNDSVNTVQANNFVTDIISTFDADENSSLLNEVTTGISDTSHTSSIAQTSYDATTTPIPNFTTTTAISNSTLPVVQTSIGNQNSNLHQTTVNSATTQEVTETNLSDSALSSITTPWTSDLPTSEYDESSKAFETSYTNPTSEVTSIPQSDDNSVYATDLTTPSTITDNETYPTTGSITILQGNSSSVGKVIPWNVLSKNVTSPNNPNSSTFQTSTDTPSTLSEIFDQTTLIPTTSQIRDDNQSPIYNLQPGNTDKATLAFNTSTTYTADINNSSLSSVTEPYTTLTSNVTFAANNTANTLQTGYNSSITPLPTNSINSSTPPMLQLQETSTPVQPSNLLQSLINSASSQSLSTSMTEATTATQFDESPVDASNFTTSFSEKFITDNGAIDTSNTPQTNNPSASTVAFNTLQDNSFINSITLPYTTAPSDGIYNLSTVSVPGSNFQINNSSTTPFVYTSNGTPNKTSNFLQSTMTTTPIPGANNTFQPGISNSLKNLTKPMKYQAIAGSLSGNHGAVAFATGDNAVAAAISNSGYLHVNPESIILYINSTYPTGLLVVRDKKMNSQIVLKPKTINETNILQHINDPQKLHTLTTTPSYDSTLGVQASTFVNSPGILTTLNSTQGQNGVTTTTESFQTQINPSTTVTSESNQSTKIPEPTESTIMSSITNTSQNPVVIEQSNTTAKPMNDSVSTTSNVNPPNYLLTQAIKPNQTLTDGFNSFGAYTVNVHDEKEYSQPMSNNNLNSNQEALSSGNVGMNTPSGDAFPVYVSSPPSNLEDDKGNNISAVIQDGKNIQRPFQNNSNFQQQIVSPVPATTTAVGVPDNGAMNAPSGDAFPGNAVNPSSGLEDNKGIDTSSSAMVHDGKDVQRPLQINSNSHQQTASTIVATAAEAPVGVPGNVGINGPSGNSFSSNVLNLPTSSVVSVQAGPNVMASASNGDPRVEINLPGIPPTFIPSLINPLLPIMPQEPNVGAKAQVFASAGNPQVSASVGNPLLLGSLGNPQASASVDKLLFPNNIMAPLLPSLGNSNAINQLQSITNHVAQLTQMGANQQMFPFLGRGLQSERPKNTTKRNKTENSKSSNLKDDITYRLDSSEKVEAETGDHTFDSLPGSSIGQHKNNLLLDMFKNLSAANAINQNLNTKILDAAKEHAEQNQKLLFSNCKILELLMKTSRQT